MDIETEQTYALLVTFLDVQIKLTTRDFASNICFNTVIHCVNEAKTHKDLMFDEAVTLLTKDNIKTIDRSLADKSYFIEIVDTNYDVSIPRVYSPTRKPLVDEDRVVTTNIFRPRYAEVQHMGHWYFHCGRTHTKSSEPTHCLKCLYHPPKTFVGNNDNLIKYVKKLVESYKLKGGWKDEYEEETSEAARNGEFWVEVLPLNPEYSVGGYSVDYGTSDTTVTPKARYERVKDKLDKYNVVIW